MNTYLLKCGIFHWLINLLLYHLKKLKVIIDGIGIFALCLGKDFASSGFLHLFPYLLLENLTCSNFQVRSASNTVLHVLAATFGHPTELEILARNHGHDSTINFLKAVVEIMKLLKHNACSLPSQAESCLMGVKSKIADMEEQAKAQSKEGSGSCYGNDFRMSHTWNQSNGRVFCLT